MLEYDKPKSGVRELNWDDVRQVQVAKIRYRAKMSQPRLYAALMERHTLVRRIRQYERKESKRRRNVSGRGSNDTVPTSCTMKKHITIRRSGYTKTNLPYQNKHPHPSSLSSHLSPLVTQNSHLAHLLPIAPYFPLLSSSHPPPSIRTHNHTRTPSPSPPSQLPHANPSSRFCDSQYLIQEPIPKAQQIPINRKSAKRVLLRFYYLLISLRIFYIYIYIYTYLKKLYYIPYLYLYFRVLFHLT